MTLEMHAGITASERLAGIEPLTEARKAVLAPALAADLIPRLCAMRRTIGANGFTVLTCSGAGSRIAAHLAPVLADVDPALRQERAPVPVHDAFGRELLSHLECSSLPLVWSGPGARTLELGKDCSKLVIRKSLGGARTAGVALPVRLGSLGNGFVVFEGRELKLSAGPLFELHRLAYRVMTDLLKLEISKAAPRQSLTDRELACLQWAGDGCKSEVIADKLGLSVHTVNAYLGSATAKLDAVNRIQAIAKAIRLGFIA